MKTVDLEYPIEVDGAHLTQVSIKRHVTVQDLIYAGGDLDDDEIHLKVAANVTEIAPKDFERLDFEDIERINDAIAEVGEAAKAPFAPTLRRPTGRDIMDLKKDWKVPGLVKVIARLSGEPESAILSLESSVFLDQVNHLMGFLGRRGRK